MTKAGSVSSLREPWKFGRRLRLQSVAAAHSRIADMDSGNIDTIIDKYPDDASSLIQVLLEIQRENRWLPNEALEKVSKRT